jgi:hypothetical protein
MVTDMNNTNPLRWSDIWFLVSLYIYSQRQQEQFKNIIATADMLNHAIMNYEEFSSALVRLTEHNLIKIETAPWKARCTKNGIEVVEPVAKQNSVGFRIWREIENNLEVPHWNPKEPLPNPENSLRYPSFTEEDYKKIISEYLQNM